LESIAGWMDISPAALRKLRAGLELQDKSVLDEMGVGAIHTGYADAFFPGTSVLHTRARYLLFVPWVYLELASRKTAPERVRDRKEHIEQWLTERLREREQRQGIIGGAVYPNPPAQPADFTYWSALRTYRLYDGVPRAQLLARWDFRRVVRRDDVYHRDDTFEQSSLGCFDVPPLPRWWMKGDAEVTFRLERGEALYLQEKLAQRDPPSLLGMAASMLGKRARPSARELWEDDFTHRAAEALDARHGGAGLRPGSAQAAIARARDASALALVVRAIYAALVERLHEQDLQQSGRLPLPEGIEQCRERLRSYWTDEDSPIHDACRLSLDELGADIEVPPLLRKLLAFVQERLRAVRRASQVEALLLDDTARELFTRIEGIRKGTRARLPLREGRSRRANFGPDTVRVRKIDYRWSVVAQLLIDIQEALFGGSE
jgi:hypothetical protein